MRRKAFNVVGHHQETRRDFVLKNSKWLRSTSLSLWLVTLPAVLRDTKTTQHRIGTGHNHVSNFLLRS